MAFEMRTIFSLVLVTLLLGACTKETSAPANVGGTPLPAEEAMDVAYGPHGQQVYDLYLPAGRSAAATKVVVLVHGGGWIGGDKADMDTLVQYLQDNHAGVAIANMNYVLGDSNTKAFPQQIQDLGAVLDHIAARSGQWQIKPEFALVGASAGAHLAMLYDYAHDPGDRVKLVADIVGPADFTDPYYMANPLFPAALALLTDLAAYPAGTNLIQALSPVHHVGPSSSPTVMFYGTTDDLVPISNAHRLDSALYAHQVPHQLSIYSGGHGNWPAADLSDMLTKISAYLQLYLGVE